MTTKPETTNKDPVKEKEKVEKEEAEKKIQAELHPLESIFYLGYAESPVITILNDGGVELKVKFRTLLPGEIRDISEIVMSYESGPAQVITERIETLARAVMTINHMHLTITNKEQTEFFDQYRKNPSPLEMARIVLNEKIRSMIIVDALYEEYIKFADEVTEKIEDIKKKSISSPS